jgi:hypothetical protein
MTSGTDRSAQRLFHATNLRLSISNCPVQKSKPISPLAQVKTLGTEYRIFLSNGLVILHKFHLHPKNKHHATIPMAAAYFHNNALLSGCAKTKRTGHVLNYVYPR